MPKKSLLLTVLLTGLILMSACGAENAEKAAGSQETTNVAIDNSQDATQGGTQKGTLEDALKEALLNDAEGEDDQTVDNGTSQNQSGKTQSSYNQSSSNQDIDNINTPVTNAKVIYTIPEEYIETGVNTDFYYNTNFPVDSSNINVVYIPQVSGTFDMDEDTYKQMIEDEFLTQFNLDVDMDILSFKKVTIDGYDALKTTMSYTYNGIDFVQYQITVQVGESTTTVTCTQVNDNDWEDTFIGVIDSVHVE